MEKKLNIYDLLRLKQLDQYVEDYKLIKRLKGKKINKVTFKNK